MKKEDIEGLSTKEMQVVEAVMTIFDALDIPQHEGNIETPFRIAKMLSRELFRNAGESTEELTHQMTLFDNPHADSSPIKIKDIRVKSTCEHHWLPFLGKCDIEYIPEDYILGLSKFPRVVKWYCNMPQIQERLTRQIGEYLVALLKPRYLKVVIRDTEHMCVIMRGVESECSTDTVFEYTNQG